MKQKKTCFINTSKLWGGGENWQVETILCFKDKIDAVSISRQDSPLQNKLKENNIRCINFAVGNLSFINPFKLLKAYRLLKKEKPHAIMFNTANDFKLFTLPARWAGVKHILYRRDNGKAMKTHLLNKFLLQKGISHFLPCSQFIKTAALSKNARLIPNEKINVIANSIHLSSWMNQKAEPLDIARNEKQIIFGCIGRLSKEKGQLYLPDIVKAVLQTDENFKVLVAGTGPLKQELKTLIDKNHLEDYIQLLGFVKSNKAFVEAIDCLLLPSEWEGLPTVAIEALALEKPVIAFKVAGNPEVVIDNQTGYLIKPFDTACFARQMIKLIHHPEEIERLGQTGKSLVEQQYDRKITNRRLAAYFLD